MLHHEAPEPPDLDAFTAGERARHAVEDRVDHDFGVAPREAGKEPQDLVDQVTFGHGCGRSGRAPGAPGFHSLEHGTLVEEEEPAGDAARLRNQPFANELEPPGPPAEPHAVDPRLSGLPGTL